MYKVNDSKFSYFQIVHTCLNVMEANLKTIDGTYIKNFLNMQMIQD